MDRRSLCLAMLAAANGREYEPVQIQKAIFLVSRNVPDIIADGPPFNFRPYDYGPFDSAVYSEIGALSQAGLAETRQSAMGHWKAYRATERGVAEGRAILDALPQDRREYIERVSGWVRSLGFGALVKSIYEAYPEMRQNSIFQY